MSNTPPPFPPSNPPGGPPFGQPPGFGAPGAPGAAPVGAPPWQAGGGGSTSLTPGPAPTSSNKKPLIIIGVIVLVAILVVVLVLALGGDDSSSSGGSVAGKGAHAGLQAVLDDSTFDEDGNDSLRVCPLGDLDDLYGAVAKAIDLDPAIADGNDDRSAREEGDLPGFVSCQRYVSDESKVDSGATSVFFQAVLDPPRDYEGYITDFAGEDTDVTFDDSVQYKGGEVFMFCAEASADSGFTGCDADWVDKENKIAINVFLGGDDAKAAETFEALKAVLPMMADNLATLADTES